jgi:hypothetical protein
MSYDLTLFPLPAGATPQSVYRELMRAGGEAAETATDFSAIQDIANLLTSKVAGLREAGAGTSFIQLDCGELDVQIVVHAGSVEISVPYFREHVRESLSCLRACVAVLGAERGYAAWDPQLGRAITPADLDGMVRQYRDVDPILPMLRKKVAAKPWWKFW